MSIAPVPVITLMGPTASGKTDVAAWLVQRFPLEIVSVDSALVYQGMDIGTAKPDAALLARAPHHLIDLLPPTEAYSAGRFRADATRAMQDIVARGRTPLLVGGTMLYFRALIDGLDDLPPADAALRAELDARAAREGWPALHAELARRDPATAARLAPNDAQRIQRALELCLVTGGSASHLLRRAAAAAGPAWRWHQFALFPQDRAWLHARIGQRFQRMLADGLVDELRGLRARYRLRAELPSMRCVGYRQAWRFLEGEIDAAALAAQGTAATRQLAKRQLTWLRSWPGVTTLDCAHQAADRLAGVLARRIEAILAL
jgi:tRNA dimethylallyltransferase